MVADATANNAKPCRLVVGRQSPALREALWRLIREVQSDDIMAPVTVVAPSSYAGLSLRQDLGKSGFVNVRFIQMPVLAELMGGETLSGQGRRPLTPTLQSIFLREALVKAPESLSDVGSHPKTQASLRSSFRELRRMDDAALVELESQGGLKAEVVRLYRSYRENAAGGWFDAEDLTAAAAQAVESGRAFALGDLGHIVFFMPGMFSRAEVELMQALARAKLCSVILGATGDPLADEPAGALAAALEPFLGQPVLLEDGDAGPGALAGHATLHVAANTHEEIREVIRQIFQESRQRGTPFHRMAVLYRMENPYGSLIQDELDMADIPLAGPARTTLAESATGRTLLGLLDLANGDYRRDEVMAWLTGCPVNLSQGAGEKPSPSRWDAISRRAGVVAGLEQWRARLAAYANRLQDEAVQGEQKGEITEIRAAHMQEESEAAIRLLAFVEGLAAAATPPPAGSSWKTHSDWARELLQSYLAESVAADGPEVIERLGRELESINKALEELASADNITPSPSRDDFMRALTDSLQAAAGHLGATGRGVFVSPFRMAAGMEFDVIWLVGMLEGGAPPAVRPDPLLPESSAPANGTPSRLTRLATEERYNYLSATATAPRRVMSYPVADSASRRAAHPSRWFLEQASALAGQAVHSRTLSAFGNRPWLTITVSSQDALSRAAPDALADTLDYNLNRLLSWTAARKGPTDHPLAAAGSLYRANLMRGRRNSRSLTEFDGNLSGIAARARFGRSLSASPISPTRLENWATCPFRYFLGYLLRLGALETPEDTATISPLERGSLIHRILERFIGGAGEDDSRQNGGDSKDGGSDEDDRQRLLRIADEEFHQAELSGVTGKRLLWRLEQLNIRDDLLAFLEKDRDLRGREGILRTEVEARFGYGAATPDVEDPDTGLRFRGSIDRLDMTGNPLTALVFDYKTGSPGPYKDLEDDPIDGGKRLQLGIYSLAARKLVPGAAQVKAAYWFVTKRGDFQRVPEDYFEIDDEDTLARFREGVSAVVNGVEAGVFPARPGPGGSDETPNCRFCDFDSLCPSRRAEAWDAKKLDPRVAGYRQLAEPPMAAQAAEGK